MRLTTPFTALRNATSDIWRMHDFNYQLPKDQRQNYWEKECIDHPTSSHCKVYWRRYKNELLKDPFYGLFFWQLSYTKFF